MARGIVSFLLAASVSTIFATLVLAQSNLYGPALLRLDRDTNTVHWSGRQGAIAYVLSYGPCAEAARCAWFEAHQSPAGKGATTRRFSASGGSNEASQRYSFRLPGGVSGWYGISVHSVGDGTVHHEYSGYHAIWRRVRGSGSDAGSGEAGIFLRLRMYKYSPATSCRPPSWSLHERAATRNATGLMTPASVFSRSSIAAILTPSMSGAWSAAAWKSASARPATYFLLTRPTRHVSSPDKPAILRMA